MLDQAKQEKVKFAQAQIAFPRLYASLGRLGKAVPADEDVPSLLVQLNHAAAQADVNFHSVELKRDLAEKAEQEAAAATPAAPAAGAEGAAPAGGEATPGAATPLRPLQPAPRVPPARQQLLRPPLPPPPSTRRPRPPAPTGGFKLLPFEYRFKGDFYDLEDLIHNMTALVERRNQEYAVTGRLISIEGFTMKRGDITVLATTYMLPADQGLFGGATPRARPVPRRRRPQPPARQRQSLRPPR